MIGYELSDVMNVRVQSSSRSVALDEDALEDEDGGLPPRASAEMLAVVESVALSGKSLLGSAEYQSLKKSGFYITSMTWKAKQTSTPFNIVEFDAGFEEATVGKSFRYNIRGLYRNRDGEFTKQRQQISTSHKELVFPIIERTALAVLAKLRASADNPVGISDDGGVR